MQRIRVTFTNGKRQIYRAEKAHVLDFAECVFKPTFETGTLILNAPYVQSVEYLSEENTNGLREALGVIGATDAEKHERSFNLAAARTPKSSNIVTESDKEDLRHE